MVWSILVKVVFSHLLSQPSQLTGFYRLELDGTRRHPALVLGKIVGCQLCYIHEAHKGHMLAQRSVVLGSKIMGKHLLLLRRKLLDPHTSNLGSFLLGPQNNIEFKFLRAL